MVSLHPSLPKQVSTPKMDLATVERRLRSARTKALLKKWFMSRVKRSESSGSSWKEKSRGCTISARPSSSIKARRDVRH